MHELQRKEITVFRMLPYRQKKKKGNWARATTERTPGDRPRLLIAMCT